MEPVIRRPGTAPLAARSTSSPSSEDRDLRAKLPRLSTVAIVLGALLPSPGQARPDARNGAALAQRWCSSCHLVSGAQHSATTDVPSFSEIAASQPDDRRLRSFLSASHPRMPDISLNRSEIDDIASYI